MLHAPRGVAAHEVLGAIDEQLRSINIARVHTRGVVALRWVSSADELGVDQPSGSNNRACSLRTIRSACG